MNYQVPNLKQLVEKWESAPGKMSIKDIADQDVKKNLATLLENQENKSFNDQRGAFGNLFETSQASTTVGSSTVNDVNAGAFQPIALALVRRTFPALFANKTVGVQAMSGPVGLAFALRFLYDTAAQPKVEAAFNEVNAFSGFSGSQSGTSGTSDSGTGVATAVGESWEIGGSPATGKMPELTLRIDRTAVTANTRKLAASFSLEAAQDIQAMHSIDVEREMVNVLQYEIQAELDRELLARMRAAAVDTANGGAPLTTIDVSTSALDGRWSQEKYSNIITQIVAQANNIAISTRRGAGNFVIVSTRLATALQAAGPQFSRNTALVDATNTLAEVGTINGTITVYRDSYIDDDEALVGYKGPGVSDAGIIYSPYITGLMSRAIDDKDFSPRIGVMSRYAITDSLLGAGRYYRRILFQNLDTLIY